MRFCPGPLLRGPGLYHHITSKKPALGRMKWIGLEAAAEGQAVVLLVGVTVARVVGVHVGLMEGMGGIAGDALFTEELRGITLRIPARIYVAGAQ